MQPYPPPIKQIRLGCYADTAYLYNTLSLS